MFNSINDRNNVEGVEQAVATHFTDGDHRNTSKLHADVCTSSALKMFERLINDQVRAHMSKHDILNEFQ